MIHRARTGYEALPLPMRRAAGVIIRELPVRLRYGSAFCAALSQARSAEEMREEQAVSCEVERLRASLTRAATTPFWSNALNAAGLNPDSALVADLASLPFTSKDDLRDRVEDLTVPSYRSARKWVTTGGTTGAPVGFWLDLDASSVDWAYTANAWSRVGYRLDEKRVVLRGVRLGEGATRALFAYEPLRRELYVSAFDLDADHLPAIRQRIDGFGARFIHGYPSAMEVLGRSYQSAGVRPPRGIEALLAVSENLYPGQRERLEALFNARLFSFYGMSEKAVFAAECSASAQLHVEPLYGVVELVDDRGCVIERPGELGEIVATSFVNRATALVRYRTGDFACWAEGPCPCGLPHRRLDAVKGRWDQEYLVGSGGARISIAALNLHSDVSDRIARFQLVQEEPGRADVLVVPGRDYSESDGDRFVGALADKVSGQVLLELRVVERIELTPRGKQPFVVQRVG